jgi:hypothetical protein
VSVQSVSAVGHLGASGARSGGDHPEDVSWGYVRVVRAGRRCEGIEAKEAQRSSKVEEHPGDGNMSVVDWTGLQSAGMRRGGMDKCRRRVGVVVSCTGGCEQQGFGFSLYALPLLSTVPYLGSTCS